MPIETIKPLNLHQFQTLRPMAAAAPNGGYDMQTMTLTPMRGLSEGVDGHAIFDTIAAAYFDNRLKENAWAKQLFATKADVEHFLGQLEHYDDCYRIRDHWYVALAGLAFGNVFNSEEGFISSREIAEAIRENLAEHKQLRGMKTGQ